MLKKKNYQAIGLFGLFLLLLTGCSNINVKSGVLNPQGPVAQIQYDLIMWSIILMLIVFVAVMVLFVFMLVKYRASKQPADYQPPDQHGSTKLEITWTVIPILIIILLAVPTVKATFDLEKSPSPEKKPIEIEATSVDWKWIFKYPEQGIVTVNYLNIPADVPVHFKLNAAGSMGALWIPELGGMEYTMPGMDMYLWLEADKPGKYIGKNANFTGEGFTHMDFEVVSMKQADFNQWTNQVKRTAPAMQQGDWNYLLKPSTVGNMTFSSYPKTAVLPHQRTNKHQHPNGTNTDKNTGGHQHGGEE
ncbi:cytochrome aa3 quinol oxidase subunit II [Risungbinella massiliensis]|uniref:cytochrome aa3 quinol oxidase subunit II n=1 Tax=Risungbinella massiliensis TaxID=1329796 RepID=UPI0005CC74C4|nr:cytochrome aa3 quinol oxidase subunit II [Risungbinella massiliensis]